MKVYEDIGPMRLMKVPAKELNVGDVVGVHDPTEKEQHRWALVTHTYPLNHIQEQAIYLDDGNTDRSPYRTSYSFTEECLILRAKKEVNRSLEEALNEGDGSYKP